MSNVRGDVDARLLVLVRGMAPEQAKEVLIFAERVAAQGRDRDRVRDGVRAAFGIWHERQDMRGDSVELVRSMRQEWEEREKSLGLA